MKTSIEIVGRGPEARRIAAALQVQTKNKTSGGLDLGTVTCRDIETQGSIAGSGAAPHFLLFLREAVKCPTAVENGDEP